MGAEEPLKELAVVMPVYNEKGCIRAVIESWRTTLDRLAIDYDLIVLNDGSRDGTSDILASLAGTPRITIVQKENSGHGPTVLAGYHMAVQRADWVFQCDSDDELRSTSFEDFWSVREQYDALFGVRTERTSAWDRRVVSCVSRCVVRTLFGKHVRDVNVPYRLIRAEILKHILAAIPDNTFAPNILIAGALGRTTNRVANLPVRYYPRATGEVSISNLRLWRLSAKALVQTCACWPALGRLKKR